MKLFSLLTGILACITTSAQNKMVLIPGGKFKPMAHWNIPENEKKVYEISEFKMSNYEVTVKEFVNFLNSTQPDSMQMEKFCCDGLPRGIRFNSDTQTYFYDSQDQNRPVTRVSWYGADAYCQWKGGRLPTEVEWFYAAAGGNPAFPYKFSGSDTAKEVAVFNKNEPDVVGSLKPNKLGLYDMSGNIGEWTSTAKENSMEYHYKRFSDKEMKVFACSNYSNPQELFLNLNTLGCFLDPTTCTKILGFRVVED